MALGGEFTALRDAFLTFIATAWSMAAISDGEFTASGSEFLTFIATAWSMAAILAWNSLPTMSRWH